MLQNVSLAKGVTLASFLVQTEDNQASTSVAHMSGDHIS